MSSHNEADKEQKDDQDENIPVIQVGRDDNPFEEDLEGDEIPF